MFATQCDVDWFERLFGVLEGSYDDVKAQFTLHGTQLVCKPSGKAFGIGRFTHTTVEQLRRSTRADTSPQNQIDDATDASVARTVASVQEDRYEAVFGDVVALHSEEANRHATFQVASGFNCLEFMDANCLPEEGVTGYQHDRTQGPACSISCGAATVYRNYFAAVTTAGGGTQEGQTAACMLNGLDELLDAVDVPSEQLCVKAGYTEATAEGLRQLKEKLQERPQEEWVKLVKVGVHEDIQVTSRKWGGELCEDPAQTVTQVFTAACSIGYSSVDTKLWEPVARIVLEAAYEGTLSAAVSAMHRHGGKGGSNRVYLTLVGGGVFMNPIQWICDAMFNALLKYRGIGLQVFVVVFRAPAPVEIENVFERLRSA